LSLKLCFALDEIVNGLSLNEIEFSVEESPLGELSTIGHPETFGLELLEDAVNDGLAAVDVELDHLLLVVGVRG
jgi:hypothetical protein